MLKRSVIIAGVLAIGHETPGWLAARGAPSELIFPFAYFLPDRTLRSIPDFAATAPFRVLFVGRIIELKRLDVLFDALARIGEFSFELVVIGSGPLEQELRAQGQTRHRGRAKAPRKSRPPTTHVATAPRQLWCWDMTFLPTQVAGRWFFLYLILDVYSRKIVGFEVHEDDDCDHAARLVQRTALAEGIHAMPRDERPVLHGDNGATLKATTVLAMLWWLGVKPSYSRPRVSDDNAFVESLFRTAKYRPEFPVEGFADLCAAREWARKFVHWYNHDHRHSGIRYVSPAQRHAGEDIAILAARHELYVQARERNPARWSRSTRDWSHIATVTLNPERDCAVPAAVRQRDTQPMAA